LVINIKNSATCFFGSFVPSSLSECVCSHLIYQDYVLYLACWWFKETETCRRIFNIDY